MQDTPLANLSESRVSWLKDICALLVVFGVLYLGLGFTRPLASPDEGRYTEIPREMAASGDWVTPRLNGMQYFYKPPMFYWLQAASIKAFGVNRISARLPNSLMAIFGILMTYAAARAIYNRRAGIFAALILGTSALYYALGQIVTLDMTVSVFMAGAMFSFIVAIKKSGLWRAALILSFFAMCAFAVLTKGLIGIVIPCAVVFFYALAVNPFRFFKMLRKSDALWIAVGCALFLAIAVPWHVLAALANPPYETADGIFSKKWEGQGFFWYYIIHEHILRYIDSETSMRAQPLWFFFVLAPLGLIPWLAIFPQTVSAAFKNGWRNLRDNNDGFIFAVIWAAFVILFFSISRSKLVPYIIPIYPALALAIGPWAARLWENPAAFKVRAASIALIALGLVASMVPAIAYPILLKDGKIIDPSCAFWVFSALSIYMLIISGLGLKFFLKGRKRAFFVCAFLSIYGLLMFVNPVGASAQRPSAEPIAKWFLQNRKDGDVIIIHNYGMFQDLPVWLGELTLNLGEPPEEQKFGFMREREIHSKRFLETPESLKAYAAARSKGDIYIAARARDIENIKKDFKFSAEEITRNGELVLLKFKGSK